jgi:hypothetical protein
MGDIDANPAGSGFKNTRRALLGAFGLATAASAVPVPVRGQVKNSGPLKSAGILAFGPENVLFVGDNVAGAVHAFELRASDLTSQASVQLGNWHNFEGRDLLRGLDVKVAAMLGTTYDKVAVNDVAVHQPTQQILMSVERGRGPSAQPAIVKLNNGELEVLELEGIPHTQIGIPNGPSPDAMLEFDPPQMYAITDVKYHDGEIFVTGISNQQFASTLYRIPYPFNSKVSTSTVEIWHPVHGEFETRAPIIRQLIRAEGGEAYLYAVYGCTPLVRFPLEALKDGAHVRGDTIGELGYGANPLDMLTYTDPFDHKDYLLVTIDTRSGSRISVADLATAKSEPTGGPIDFGPGGLGLTQRHLPIHAEHMAILNSKWAVVIWRHPRTSYRLDITTLMVPYFFERKDGMSEMNWPNGPDPFHYRAARNEIDDVGKMWPPHAGD